MWNKLSQVAGLTPVENEEEKEETSPRAIDEEQLQQQELLVQQLKDIVRENEKRFQDKTKEYDDLSSKFQKFKLQTKAKIAHLSTQIKEQERTAKKEDCDFDDTSSSDSSDQSRRGKVLLLKRQLDQVKHQLDKKEEESKKIIDGFEKKINDLTLQLNEKNSLISSLADAGPKDKTSEAPPDQSPKKEINMQEMYAQIVYKDTKIMGLNNQILELEKQIIDLQEHIKDKDEVLQQRNRAVQLMAEDLNRKGQTVVDELGDTREQMKIMQENFSTTENDWKLDLEKYKNRISELETNVMEFTKKLKNNEMVVKNLETARSELMTKNAELQKKIVVVQESASKQCELYNKEIGVEVDSLKKRLESEIQHSAELQKALDESSTQSNNKVLKARVNERTKFKALERELNELKKEYQKKPQEILELQERIAELEEEKGSLQLKLMDIEDQVIQLEKLKEENEALKITVEEGISKIQNFEEQIKTLEGERENWEIKFNVLNDEFKELEEKYNITDLEKIKQQEEAFSLVICKEKLQNDYNELEKEYSAVKKMYNDSLQNLEQLKDQKVTFELKSIELEEIRENDDKIKKELLSRIQQLEESFSDESKPDIQLEKENLELKDKLRDLTSHCNEIEENSKALSIQIENLQQKLSDGEKEYSLEIGRLNSRIKDIESMHEEVLCNLKSKIHESTEQSKLIKELESSFSSVQNELSNIFSYFGAKDVNDCKNYAIKKAEEYSHLRSDYEKAMKEKDNLLLNLTGKDGEIQKYCSKIEEFTLVLEQHENQSQSLKEAIENLNDTILEKESHISKISSELQDRITSEKAFSETLKEKSESLLKAVEHEKSLSQELDTAKEALVTYKEKVTANNSSLLGQISDMENEIDSIRGELGTKISVIENLTTSLQSIQKENELLKEKLKDQEKTIEENDVIIKSLKSDNKNIEDSLSSLTSENKALKVIEASKNAELSLLTNIVEQYTNKIKIKEEELSKVAHDLQQTSESVTMLDEKARLLKEKNTMLEEEKLHSNRSLSEKDEVHQRVLSEKLHLESEVLRIQEENSSLHNSLKDKEDKLDFVDTTINKMVDLVGQDDSKVQEFLLYVPGEENNLINFAQRCFSVISKSQIAIHTLTNENSSLQHQLTDIHTTVEKQLQELKNSGLTIDKLKKECEENSEKVLAFQNDLVASNNARLQLDDHINELEAKIMSLSEANALLSKNINSSHEEHALQVLSLHNELTACQVDIKSTNDKIKIYENEKMELEKLCNSLNTSLTNYELEVKKQESETEYLNEEKVSLENKLVESNRIVEDFKEEIRCLQNEVEQINVTFSEEKSALKQLLQNASADNKNLQDLIAELESRVLEYQNISLSNENTTSDLQSLLSNKDTQISDLKHQVNALNGENTNLQTVVNENKAYKQSIEAKLESLITCKQHFSMILETLLSSYQLDLDVSFLESDDLINHSIDEFIQESKIIDSIVKHASEYQSLHSLCNDLKNDVKCLKAINLKVCSECDTLKNQLIEIVTDNLKQNDSKYDVIFSAFQDKENSMQRLESKLSILRDSYMMLKNHVASLESERDIYLNELKITKEYLEKSEKTIQTLIDEKEVINQNMHSISQVYETKISELVAIGKEMSSKSDYFEEELRQKQNDFEKYMQDIQKLQVSIKTKDETISKMIEEQQSNANSLISQGLELENAHASISSLQNEVKQLNKQLNEYTAESQVLESANNVSNGLQVVVEQLRSDLAFCEEQKNSLQQHVDNTNVQLQSLISEKSYIEARMKEMEHKLNDLTEMNLKLNNAVEDSNSSVLNYEQKCSDLLGESSKHKALHEVALKEIESLKSEKTKFHLQENDLLKKISILEENCNSLRSIVDKVHTFVSETENLDYDLQSLTVDVKDEGLIIVFSELLSKLVEARNSFIKEKENFQAEIDLLKSQNRDISDHLEKAKEFQQDKSDTSKDSSDIKEISIMPSPDMVQSLDKNLVQQQDSTSSPYSSDKFTALENDYKSLTQEMTECKAKFAKSLDKLKLFKAKNDKLNGELKDFKEKNAKLELLMAQSLEKERELLNKFALLENEKEELVSNLQSISKQMRYEKEKSNEAIVQLKQRNSNLDEECYEMRQELEEYKHSWKESNVSFELQKEDNHLLRTKTKELLEQIDSSKAQILDLNNQLMQTESENLHLKQEAQNLKEHANMLLSDNDTYQGLIEKLKASKSSLEQRLIETKDKFAKDLKALQNEHKLELERLELKQTESTAFNAVEEENECSVLRNQCMELQRLSETLQNERDTYLRNQNLLEKEKVYLQQQLLENADELQKTRSRLDTKALALPPDYIDEKNESNTVTEINKLKEENESYKSQFANLIQELNVTKENFLYLQNDGFSKEAYYMDKINQLEAQLQQQFDNVKGGEKEIFDARKIEGELSQAMNSLHKQGLRCEELSVEVSKLLEERDMLKWQLQQSSHLSTGIKTELGEPDNTSDLIAIKIESPSSSSDIATLHARLKESEKTCQQLRQANEALDRALNIERDQKQFIEEELGYAKEHLTEEAKASDEYQILLGDINEPEMFAETNFSISRNVRTHAYKFRRWIRGRRNYLWRTVRSRNYPQLVYIFYICFIHIWLLACVFS